MGRRRSLNQRANDIAIYRERVSYSMIIKYYTYKPRPIQGVDHHLRFSLSLYYIAIYTHTHRQHQALELWFIETRVCVCVLGNAEANNNLPLKTLIADFFFFSFQIK